MTKQLSVSCVFFLLTALLLMQTLAGLHRGSTPVTTAQLSATVQTGSGAQTHSALHAGHNLHDDLFGALEGKSSCHLLDHLLEPPTATSDMPCVSALSVLSERIASAMPSRISRFQRLGQPARGPPIDLS